MTDIADEWLRHYREEADRLRRLAGEAKVLVMCEALRKMAQFYDELATEYETARTTPGSGQERLAHDASKKRDC